MEDNDICARVLLALSNRAYFLGDFLKISLGPPFPVFQKMGILSDLPKIAITLPSGHSLEPLFSPKSFPVFALQVHTN